MAEVNPPPHVKLPKKLAEDPELRAYFQNRDFIQFQLWQKQGGGSDLIEDANQRVPTIHAEVTALQLQIGSGDALTSDETGFTVDSTTLTVDMIEA